VSAIEHDGTVLVAIAAHEHYDGDCLWAGRHDCGESFLQVRDFSSGTEVARLDGAGGEWVSLIVVDDRVQAVVANWLEPVRCWDIASGDDRIIATPPHPVWCMTTGWLGSRPVVLANADWFDAGEHVLAWDLATGDVIEEFNVPTRGWPRALGQLDGAWFHGRQPAQSGGAVLLRRLGDGAALAEVQVGPSPSAIAVSGPILAVARPGVVELHDLATGSARSALTGHTSWARLAPLTLGGRPHLVTASDYGEARLWDLATSAPAGDVRHADPVSAALFVATASGELLVTADAQGTLLRWRGADGQPAGPPLADRTGPVRSLAAIAAEGEAVLVTAGGSVTEGSDSTLRRWDLVTGTQAGAPLDGSHCGMSWCLAAETDSRVAVLSGGNDGYLTTWDPATGERLGHEETGRYPVSGLAAGKINGRPAAIVTRAIIDPVRFIDLTDWSQLDLTVGEDWRFDKVHGLVTGDGDPVMVTTDGNGTLRLWTLDEGAWRARDIEHEAARVIAVAVASRPRPMVAVGYADRTLVIIDPLTTGRLAGPVQLPEIATALAFSASGDLAACYGIDVAVFPADQ
jgi:WD40 repeat protein